MENVGKEDITCPHKFIAVIPEGSAKEVSCSAAGKKALFF